MFFTVGLDLAAGGLRCDVACGRSGDPLFIELVVEAGVCSGCEHVDHAIGPLAHGRVAQRLVSIDHMFERHGQWLDGPVLAVVGGECHIGRIAMGPSVWQIGGFALAGIADHDEVAVGKPDRAWPLVRPQPWEGAFDRRAPCLAPVLGNIHWHVAAPFHRAIDDALFAVRVHADILAADR